MIDWLSNQKDAIGSLKDLFSIFAIIVGAVWTYRAFIANRTMYPRAKGRFNISDFRLEDDRAIIRVQFDIENVGQSLMQITSMFARIQQVSPIPMVDGKPFDPTSDFDSNEIPWPLIAEYKHEDKGIIREIEPSETDTLSFDFLVSSDVHRVYLNIFVENLKKKAKWYYVLKRRRIGWEFSTMYEIQRKESKYEGEAAEGGSAGPTKT